MALTSLGFLSSKTLKNQFCVVPKGIMTRGLFIYYVSTLRGPKISQIVLIYSTKTNYAGERGGSKISKNMLT